MGYDMWQRDCQGFFIPHDKLADATEVLNKLDKAVKSFEDHLYDYGFETEFDKDGNVTGLYFVGEKLWEQDTLLKELIPFVKEGAFIEFMGEDFTHWRWVFRKGELIEIEPDIIWHMEETS